MKIKLFIFSLFLFGIANAQMPTWLWADGSGGTDYDYGTAICTDSAGNSVVTGCFSSFSVNFGGNTLIGYTGGDDFYLVKYDPNGNVLWAKTVGGNHDDRGTCVAHDVQGNIYVGGFFTSTNITFGTTQLNNPNNSFYERFFLVKYDSTGNVLWAKTSNSTAAESEVCTAIAVAPDGSIYVTGRFDWGNAIFGIDTLTNSGVFITKFDNSGNVLWARDAAKGYAGGYGIACDVSNNVFVAGRMDIDTLVFGNNVLTESDSSSIFIVKYDPNGNALWARSASGSGPDMANSIDVDNYGDAYITGITWSPVTYFGSSSIISTPYFGSVFVAKYNTNGGLTWVRGVPSTDLPSCAAIKCGPAGLLYMTGTVFDSLMFPMGTLVNPWWPTADIFVAAYDNMGNNVWATSVGGSMSEQGYGIDVDGSDDVYLIGQFASSPLNFGPSTITSFGAADVWVGKLSNPNGILENQKHQNFSIYPNPCHGDFAITSSEEIVTVEIFNLLGQTIKVIRNNSGNTINFNKEEFVNGLYIIRVTGINETISSQRLVISD